MAKVATRGGGGGAFWPFREGGTEVGAGDVGDVDFIAAAVHMAKEVRDARRDGVDWVINSKKEVVALWCHTTVAEVGG